VSSVYDFSKLGAGKYSFIPSNTFYYVDPKTSKPVTIYARSAAAHQLAISGSLTPSSAQSSSKVAKRATFNGCSDDEESQLNDAITTAQNYAQETSEYTDEQVEATPRYTTWFGDYSDDSHAKVSTAFDKINGSDFSSFTYDCSCKIPDVFAYVYPDT
jgi:peptidyl-Lys metalloendopeptidase